MPWYIALEPHPDPADLDTVTSGLRRYNIDVIGEPAEEPVHVLLRDDAGAVVGGLIGHIRWRWLYVSKLYSVFGTLEGYPPGYRQYYLAKRLATDSSENRRVE